MAVSQNDVLRATVEGIWNGNQDIQNVFQMQKVDSGSISEALALDDVIAILELLYATISAILSVLWTVQGGRVVNVTQSTDVGFGLFADTTPGTDAGAAQAPQVAYGVSLTTERLKVRGRKFLGPTIEGLVDNDGIISAPTLLDLADFCDEMVSTQIQTNGDWNIGVIASFDSVFLPFQSFTISPTAVTQRRRRLGVGS